MIEKRQEIRGMRSSNKLVTPSCMPQINMSESVNKYATALMFGKYLILVNVFSVISSTS